MVQDCPNPQLPMNDFFHKWSSTAENYLLKVAQVNGPHYRGRGCRPKFISKPTQAPPANEFSGAATTRLLSLLKLQRRLQQLQKKNPEPCLDSLASLQLTALKNSCVSSWRIFPQHELPDLGSTSCFLQTLNTLEIKIKNLQQSTTQHRLHTFKEKLIADWKADKKATYRWLRDAQPCVTPIFQRATHEFAVKHQELHQLMWEACLPIFNRFRDKPEPSFDNFIQLFPNCMPPDFQFSAAQPLVIDNITPEQVYSAIQNLKVSAPGADAWQVRELKLLRSHSIHKLAELLNNIECTGCWPQQLQEIPVAALKKPRGSAAKDIRPIALASHLYRLWAKIRWADLQSWHLSWLPPQLKGGAKNREAVDAYYELMLEVGTFFAH